MSDPDRLTSHDDKAFVSTRGALSFGFLWLRFSPRSFGIRSSLRRCRDTLREEPRARCEFLKRPFAGRSLRNDTIRFRRNTTLRLFAGISVLTGGKNPAECAPSPGNQFEV